MFSRKRVCLIQNESGFSLTFQTRIPEPSCSNKIRYGNLTSITSNFTSYSIMHAYHCTM